MEYEQEKQKKPGREEFKKDVTEAIKDAKPKRKRAKGKKYKKGKYDDMSAKELY